MIAKNLRAIRPKAYTHWHLDESVPRRLLQ
jgi:hypothetical protein